MKNIKAIELTKPAFGLQAGTVLSRLNHDEPFSYVNENVGDNFESYSRVTVPHAMITADIAKATEWFEDRRRSAKHVIAELQEELDITSMALDIANEELANVTKKYNELTRKMNSKITEYEAKLKQTQLDLENDFISGESIEWADEAMTVYYNLIDLLKKLLNE